MLNKFGKSVVVIEAQPRVLSRVAGEPLSRFYEAEHRARGVDLRMSAVVERIEERRGRVCGVRLADVGCATRRRRDRRRRDCAGGGTVGWRPARAGGNGADVDTFCRTSLVKRLCDWRLCRTRESLRPWRISCRSVPNAHDQATVVAHGLTGQRARDLFDAILVLVEPIRVAAPDYRTFIKGMTTSVVRGRPETRSFSIVFIAARAELSRSIA